MNKGWISINRKLQSHWIWEEKRVFSKLEAWLDILLTVNHTEQKVMIKNTLYTVKRGESIKCLDTWAKRWNWNKSKVRRFFVLLKSDEMITTKNEGKTTRLTVCKYDSYQDVRNANETQTKRKRNANETQATPNNNDNNINNDNNENNDVVVTSTNDDVFISVQDCKVKYLKDERMINAVCSNKQNKIKVDEVEKRLTSFVNRLTQTGEHTKNYKDFKHHFLAWHKKEKASNPSTKRRNFL